VAGVFVLLNPVLEFIQLISKTFGDVTPVVAIRGTGL